MMTQIAEAFPRLNCVSKARCFEFSMVFGRDIPRFLSYTGENWGLLRV